jgi:hypothetical protein
VWDSEKKGKKRKIGGLGREALGSRSSEGERT